MTHTTRSGQILSRDSGRKGRKNKLIGQIGEYLAAAELARRNFIATPFSGNVPDFDILAINSSLRTTPIQVKAIRTGSWQFAGDRFLNIKISGVKQQIIGKKKLSHDNLIFILVKLGDSYGGDEFFLLSENELQDTLDINYHRWLKKNAGVRPRNPKSTHCTIAPKEIMKYEDRWGVVTKYQKCEE